MLTSICPLDTINLEGPGMTVSTEQRPLSDWPVGSAPQAGEAQAV